MDYLFSFRTSAILDPGILCSGSRYGVSNQTWRRGNVWEAGREGTAVYLYSPFSSASLNSFTLLFAYFLVSVQFHFFLSHRFITFTLDKFYNGVAWRDMIGFFEGLFNVISFFFLFKSFLTSIWSIGSIEAQLWRGMDGSTPRFPPSDINATRGVKYV